MTTTTWVLMTILATPTTPTTPPSPPAPSPADLQAASLACQRSLRDQRGGEYDRNDPCVCRALVGLPTTASCQDAARRR